MFTVRGQTFLAGQMTSEYTQNFISYEEARMHAIELEHDNPRMIIMVEFTDTSYNELIQTDWVNRSIMNH